VVTAEFALYLRNQLLRDSDWASMWHGVELRVPYVDRTFLEACAANVVAARGAGGKRLLAEAPSPALPTAVARRPKTGFSLPMSSWTVRAIRNGLLQMPSFLALGEPRRDSMALADQVERGELHWSRAWSLTVLDRYVRPAQWGRI
jgi:asparagine synthase (glutamine-hydrolysing)